MKVRRRRASSTTEGTWTKPAQTSAVGVDDSTAIAPNVGPPATSPSACAWLASELTVARVHGSRPRFTHAASTGSLTSHTAAAAHSAMAANQNDRLRPNATTADDHPDDDHLRGSFDAPVAVEVSPAADDLGEPDRAQQPDGLERRRSTPPVRSSRPEAHRCPSRTCRCQRRSKPSDASPMRAITPSVTSNVGCDADRTDCIGRRFASWS